MNNTLIIAAVICIVLFYYILQGISFWRL